MKLKDTGYMKIMFGLIKCDDTVGHDIYHVPDSRLADMRAYIIDTCHEDDITVHNGSGPYPDDIDIVLFPDEKYSNEPGVSMLWLWQDNFRLNLREYCAVTEGEYDKKRST